MHDYSTYVWLAKLQAIFAHSHQSKQQGIVIAV